jgi:GNAT superfamily N-acetyltransferase
MPISVEPITDHAAKSTLCARIIAELPMWFGRPEANASYIRNIADRDVFAASFDARIRGLIALEYHFAVTCNIWWLGVSPAAHRRGLGRALIEQAAEHARTRGCRRLAVETMSPRAHSAEYDLTRRFYAAVGFVPFVEFEPEPGDHMMWMLREL